MSRRCRLARLLLFVAASLISPALLRADTLPEGSPFRRPLSFKQFPSDAPGQNAAVAEFYTDGHARSDGSDIRVTTAERILVPCKILQISPTDDFVRIAFATLGDGPYYVWWGDPKPPPPSKDLDIQRGIYTQVFRTPPGAQRDARNASDGLEKLFSRAKPLGALFVPQIFLAYNPLGEESDAMFRYRAQFKIDTPLNADFAFTVANTGALIIDGKVIDQQFRGGMKGRVRDPRSVALSPGWHSLEVTQVNLDGGSTGVVVAWRRDDRRYEPLPESLFAPITHAVAGPLEHVGAAPTNYAADFAIIPEAEAFAPASAYIQRYSFDADYPPTFHPTITWDFGDGQSASALKRASHIYLLPGTYTVTLKIEQTGHLFTAVRRITIQDRMYSRFPRPPEDSPKIVAAALAGDSLQKPTGEQALRGLLYFKGVGDSENIAAWGKAWLAAKDAPPGSVAFDETFDLARLFELRRDYNAAVDAFRQAAAKPLPMTTRLQLLRYQIMTACDYTAEAAAALKEAQSWEKLINDNNPEQQRTLQVAIAYAAIAANDGKLARSTLDQLAPDAPAGAAYKDAQIRQGVLARNIENYIRTREFDTALKLIDDWELEFPEALWDGFTRTLRVKLDAAEGRPDIAAKIAVQHATANPGSFYAAELLYRASENFNAAHDPTQAKAAMDLLTRKYPESPYARGETKEK